ncbi:MAG TPA: hypothetical protein PLS03_07065 [Terrimicrobiaceae bacterium]|nr:hypothetical protein [Terrimicrobiaceae bacterium]
MPGSKRFLTVFFAITCLLGVSAKAVEFESVYSGETPVQESDLAISETRKGGGGKVTQDGGRLRLEVPAGANHFFNVEGGPGLSYNGATESGTTIDFSLTVQGTDATQAGFAIRVGTGEGSWSLSFFPDEIRIGSRSISHAVREGDTYRLAFQNGKMSVYSERKGELATEIQAEKKYGENRLSFGTRGSIEVVSPVSWELGFIRWTNKGATFAPPSEK